MPAEIHARRVDIIELPHLVVRGDGELQGAVSVSDVGALLGELSSISLTVTLIACSDALSPSKATIVRV